MLWSMRLLENHITRSWEGTIVDELCEFIRIPGKSPSFDADWARHGYMDEVASRFIHWARQQPIEGLHAEIVRLEGRTPLIYIDIPGAAAGTVLLYGHLDKQPEMVGWNSGLGPWTPVLGDDRLYGRGGADDGYALFAALTAIAALQLEGRPHARCVVIIEGCEESGSYDLPHYVRHLAERIGEPELVVCLDSGCGNYEQLWSTTSLRGLVGGTLDIAVLTEGVHSGDAGGVVPSPLRLLRQLLDRVEDASNGRVKLEACQASIPGERRAEAVAAAEALGASLYRRFPFVPGADPAHHEVAELILNRTWRPSLSITGAEGLPALADAGNVLLPRVAAKLSLRLPPTCDPETVRAELERRLTEDPPCGARIQFRTEWSAAGWHAPPTAHWLSGSLERSSQSRFGRAAMYMGEGGTIPFMAMLEQLFPTAQFVVTGVLGPQSNAHGPNEFLHLPTAERLTACVADILGDHALAAG
jgi:acetylornithine deacetylase/succinyl-diaminopimelate desuccinylase-like protein